MEPLIRVDALGKVYRTAPRAAGVLAALKGLVAPRIEENAALKQVSFTVAPGEIVGLIGPNGAGKSTLIKTLAGVLHPSAGWVRVMGYTPWTDRAKYVRHIGVVFGQKEQLWWDLPAIDSFLLNRDLYGLDHAAFDARLERMVSLLQLGSIIHTPTRDLSLGERMKCKLVAALLHEPTLVFLDEPSIGLDVVAKDILRDFILEVNRERRTTFLVTTHDMQDIERLCKRILIINFGEILYDGPLATIKRRYLNSKVIDVLFETEAPPFHLPGCTVAEHGKYALKLRVDTAKVPVKEVVAHIMRHYEFADLIINDPPIEEIIARIYKENGRIQPGPESRPRPEPGLKAVP